MPFMIASWDLLWISGWAGALWRQLYFPIVSGASRRICFKDSGNTPNHYRRHSVNLIFVLRIGGACDPLCGRSQQQQQITIWFPAQDALVPSSEDNVQLVIFNFRILAGTVRPDWGTVFNLSSLPFDRRRVQAGCWLLHERWVFP